MPECHRCGNKKMERIWHMEDDKTYWYCYTSAAVSIMQNGISVSRRNKSN